MTYDEPHISHAQYSGFGTPHVLSVAQGMRQNDRCILTGIHAAYVTTSSARHPAQPRFVHNTCAHRDAVGRSWPDGWFDLTHKEWALFPHKSKCLLM